MTQPHDLDAERAVLGALLSGADPADFPLASAHFYRPAHQLIFEAACTLRAAGKPVDTVTVHDQLRRDRTLSQAGGGPYLHTVMEAAPLAASAGHYARIVREHSERRLMIERASRVIQAASDPGTELRIARDIADDPDTPDGSDSVAGSDLLAGVRDGGWLSGQNFPPLAYAIDGLIPEGLTLEVGPPKAGKSWLTLGLLLAVASGGVALGSIKASPARRVLYLALEDGDRRMQDRCRALLGEPGIPPLFSYLTRIMPGTVLPTIEAWMHRYPDTAMVVVDTLGKVMPPASQGESAYQRDYRVGSALKAQADARPGLAVMVLHHDRKANAEDFVDSVSGTHGLAGAADTIVVLSRKRQSPEGSLKITGRDVPENEYALKVIEGKAWQLDGADLAAAAATARTREDARAISDVSAQVLDAIRQHPEGIRAGDLTGRFGRDVYQYLKRLTDAGRIDKVTRGLYVPIGVSEPSEPSGGQVKGGSGSDNVVSMWPKGSNGDEENE